MLRQTGNVLLLDEPTNDLDVDTLRALEQALLNFAGSLPACQNMNTAAGLAKSLEAIFVLQAQHLSSLTTATFWTVYGKS